MSSVCAQQFIELTKSTTPLVIDVRTASEAASEKFEPSINLPLQTLSPAQVQQCCVDQQLHNMAPIFLLCGTGIRAQRALDLLQNHISNPIFIIEGGINALKEQQIQLQNSEGKTISLERQVHIAAGVLILIGLVFGFWVSPMALALPVLVGAGLTYAGITNHCGMSLALAQMPWNNARTKH